MAQKRFDELTAATSLVDADLLAAEVGVGGTPSQKKINALDLANTLATRRAAGGLMIAGNATVQALSSGAWTEINWMGTGAKVENNIGINLANGRATVSQAGTYAALWCATVFEGTGTPVDLIFNFAFYKTPSGGSPAATIATCGCKTVNLIGAVRGPDGPVNLLLPLVAMASGDLLSVYVQASATANFILTHGQLLVVRLF